MTTTAWVQRSRTLELLPFGVSIAPLSMSLCMSVKPSAMFLPYGQNKLLSTLAGTAKVRESHPTCWGGANAGFGWVAPERVRYNQRLIV